MSTGSNHGTQPNYKIKTMKRVKLFEQFLNEAARLRSKKDWKKDIAYELGASRDGIISDDIDDDDFEGYFEAKYDGYTGFDITLFDADGEEVKDDFIDCEGMGSSEIQSAIFDTVYDMVSSPYRKGR